GLAGKAAAGEAIFAHHHQFAGLHIALVLGVQQVERAGLAGKHIRIGRAVGPGDAADGEGAEAVRIARREDAVARHHHDGERAIVMMTRNRIFAARDPHGFRPLSIGRITGTNGAPDTYVFASETCAFDLLHAKYERDVKPGELVMVSEDGLTSRRFASET